ncbi:MAG: hypothetical protein AAF074_16295 [Pseudomonadota bacterium]
MPCLFARIWPRLAIAFLAVSMSAGRAGDARAEGAIDAYAESGFAEASYERLLDLHLAGRQDLLADPAFLVQYGLYAFCTETRAALGRGAGALEESPALLARIQRALAARVERPVPSRRLGFLETGAEAPRFGAYDAALGGLPFRLAEAGERLVLRRSLEAHPSCLPSHPAFPVHFEVSVGGLEALELIPLEADAAARFEAKAPSRQVVMLIGLALPARFDMEPGASAQRGRPFSHARAEVAVREVVLYAGLHGRVNARPVITSPTERLVSFGDGFFRPLQIRERAVAMAAAHRAALRAEALPPPVDRAALGAVVAAFGGVAAEGAALPARLSIGSQPGTRALAIDLDADDRPDPGAPAVRDLARASAAGGTLLVQGMRWRDGYGPYNLSLENAGAFRRVPFDAVPEPVRGYLGEGWETVREEASLVIEPVGMRLGLGCRFSGGTAVFWTKPQRVTSTAQAEEPAVSGAYWEDTVMLPPARDRLDRPAVTVALRAADLARRSRQTYGLLRMQSATELMVCGDAPRRRRIPGQIPEQIERVVCERMEVAAPEDWAAGVQRVLSVPAFVEGASLDCRTADPADTAAPAIVTARISHIEFVTRLVRDGEEEVHYWTYPNAAAADVPYMRVTPEAFLEEAAAALDRE